MYDLAQKPIRVTKGNFIFSFFILSLRADKILVEIGLEIGGNSKILKLKKYRTKKSINLKFTNIMEASHFQKM